MRFTVVQNQDNNEKFSRCRQHKSRGAVFDRKGNGNLCKIWSNRCSIHPNATKRSRSTGHRHELFVLLLHIVLVYYVTTLYYAIFFYKIRKFQAAIFFGGGGVYFIIEDDHIIYGRKTKVRDDRAPMTQVTSCSQNYIESNPIIFLTVQIFILFFLKQPGQRHK